MGCGLTLGSLFDGIGGFPLAGAMCGIRPVWSSEIEAFPLKVTAARFPDVKQLGSVTDIDGAIYKAYGNGLALPCAYDVMSRIARFVERERGGTTSSDPGRAGATFP